MSKRDGFEVTWEADDGYAGGSAPHRFTINPDDIEPEASEEDLKSLFWEYVQQDFEQRVSPVSDDEDRFLVWAKEKQKNED